MGRSRRNRGTPFANSTYRARSSTRPLQLFPHNKDAAAIFEGKQDLIESTAFRDGSPQGAYLILAARALGLDCGPMSGFDAQKVNHAFFPEGGFRVNFLCNIGYGDRSKVLGRLPRLAFEEVCEIL